MYKNAHKYENSNGVSLIIILIIVIGLFASYTGWVYMLDVLFPAEVTPKAYDLSASQDLEYESKSSRDYDSTTTKRSLKNNLASSSYSRENGRKIKNGDGNQSDDKAQAITKGGSRSQIYANSAGRQEHSKTTKAGSPKNKPGAAVLAQNHYTSNDSHSYDAANGTNRSHSGSSSAARDDEPNDEDMGELPYGRFSISGQVLDDLGHPLSGIEIIAKLRKLFDSENQIEDKIAPQQRTYTNEEGRFLFENVANGEYDVGTKSTSDYLTTSKTVRAGNDAVQLKLVVLDEIHVFGQVLDQDGEAIHGVEILPSGQKEPLVSSGNGDYGFNLIVRSDRGNVIKFSADGFLDKRLSIGRNDWRDLQEIQRDVVMEPERLLTDVSGVLKNNKGEPVAEEQVYLQSSHKKFRGNSDKDGHFTIKDVEVGVQYALWLSPKGPYKRYRKTKIEVPEAGLNNMEVVLDPLGAGSLSGQLIDTEGNPVPNFTLIVRSKSGNTGNSLKVISDQEGNFFVENVPEGQITLQTTSFPRFEIKGIEVKAGDEIEVFPKIDIGNHKFTGQVINAEGDPIPLADITFTWLQRENKLWHESQRRATANADGVFTLTKLGPGKHQILVRAKGYEFVKEQFEVGGMDGNLVEIQMEELES